MTNLRELDEPGDLSDFDVDAAADITIVMSRKELETILAIDEAHARRAFAHEHPTVTMLAVREM